MPRPRTRALLEAIRRPEVRPVTFVEIYLDPSSSVPDFAFVDQLKAVQWNDRRYESLGWARGGIATSNDGAEQSVRLQLDDCDGQFHEQVEKVPLAGARVELKQAFVGSLSDASASYTLFVGRGKGPQFVIGTMVWEIASYLDALNFELPRRSFSRGCGLRWGFSGCGVNRESFRSDLSAESGSTDRVLIDSTNLIDPEGTWDNGFVEINDPSTPYDGTRRQIHDYDSTNGRLYFRHPFPVALAGLTCRVWAGCKKTKEDCATRFSNIDNYGGFAEIPKKPEIPIGKKG